jgi:hypothetical protein
MADDVVLNNAPHDPALNKIWGQAIGWTLRSGQKLSDETVTPVYEKLLKYFTDASGNVNPNKHPFPMPIRKPYKFRGIPGLVIRPATLDDVQAIARVLVDRGNMSLEIAIRNVTDAIEHKLSWAFIWEYNGQPLQFETVYIGFDDPDQVYLGMTTHFNRERPHWLWRELEKPLWDWLRKAGFTRLYSFLRTDREFWLPALQKNYGCKVVSKTEKYFRLEFDLTADDIFKGWPKRRTLGPTWRWAHEDFQYREMQEDEIPMVEQWIDDTFRLKLPRKQIAKAMLRIWWDLDRATVLLGYKGDELRHVRIVRERDADGKVASVAMLNPIWKKDHKVAVYGSVQWLQSVGYTEVTSFVPESQWVRPHTQFFLSMGHVKVKQQHHQYAEVFFEVTTDVNEFLQQSVNEWMAKPWRAPEGSDKGLPE